MADWKGLEPSTFRVTGGRSNQLNYQSKVRQTTNAHVRLSAERGLGNEPKATLLPVQAVTYLDLIVLLNLRYNSFEHLWVSLSKLSKYLTVQVDICLFKSIHEL